MLDQLERFNQSLRERIEEATRDLRASGTRSWRPTSISCSRRVSRWPAPSGCAALGQVAANVAHQAGTPLNLVSGYVQMIRDDPRTDDRTRSRLQTVTTQIQHVTRVLRTMLDHAKQPSGFETVALADILERVREVAATAACRAPTSTWRSPSAAACRRFAPTPPRSRWPCSTSSPTLSTPCPAAVRCRCQRPATASGIRLEVADSGPGIAAAIARPPVRSVGDDQAGRTGHRSRPGDRAGRHAGARRRDHGVAARRAARCSRSSCRPRLQNGNDE